jgi:hypothetical protein
MDWFIAKIFIESDLKTCVYTVARSVRGVRRCPELVQGGEGLKRQILSSLNVLNWE